MINFKTVNLDYDNSNNNRKLYLLKMTKVIANGKLDKRKSIKLESEMIAFFVSVEYETVGSLVDLIAVINDMIKASMIDPSKSKQTKSQIKFQQEIFEKINN